MRLVYSRTGDMGKRSQGWGVFGEMIARGPAFFWLSLRARVGPGRMLLRGAKLGTPC